MVISFPCFESHLLRVLAIARQLHAGDREAAIAGINALMRENEKVRGSARHRSLCDFLAHALIACERSEFEGAATVLLSAAEYFTHDEAA